MKKGFLALLTCCFFSGVFSQDIPDYRTNKENVLRMREKDLRQQVATFTFAGIEEAMGRKPLEVIRPTSYNNEEIFFNGADIKVHIRKGPFIKETAKIDMYDEKYPVKINKKPFYGSFGRMPATRIESVTVLMGGDTIAIPPAAYADLYNPAFTYRDKSGAVKSLNGVYFSPDKRNVYIYLLSRNGNDGYEVTWIIQDKKYLRRVLDYGQF